MNKADWKGLIVEDVDPVEGRSVLELERDLRAADRAAATAHREMRACEMNFYFHLSRGRELAVMLEKKKDRRRAASRELGSAAKRRR